MLGKIHEERLEPNPKPVSLSFDLRFGNLHRLPLPFVCPSEHAVVLFQAGFDLSGEAAFASGEVPLGRIGGGGALVAIVVSHEDDVIARAHFAKECARNHDDHENRVQNLKMITRSTAKDKTEEVQETLKSEGNRFEHTTLRPGVFWFGNPQYLDLNACSGTDADL